MIEKINEYWWHDGHFNEDQRDYFISILKELQPKTALELGWATGRSCITILIAGNPEKMLSIDINLDYMDARSHADLMIKDFNNLNILEGNSNSILTTKFLDDEFPNGIDFIFVDGCHTYQCAKRDCNKAYQHLSPGGIMIVDDYNSGPPNGWKAKAVDKAVNDFSKSNNLSFNTWNKKGKGCAIFKK
tara:strand:- start:61 stop:624 length:564 start_codon:yes stop_codon:yes gene_type:complete